MPSRQRFKHHPESFASIHFVILGVCNMKSHLPHLTDEHAKAIAHVSIRSAALDHAIEVLLLEAYYPNRRTAERILKSQSQARFIELIQEMLIDRFPWHAGDIETFIASVKSARKKRNDVIHHLWGEMDENGAALLASYRPFRDPVEKSMTAAEVGSIADELLEHGSTMFKVMFWLQDQRPPLPDLLVHTLQRRGSSWPLGGDQ